MSGWKKTFEDAGGPFLFGAMIVLVLTLAGLAYIAQPKAEPFRPMELVCVDSEGKPVVRDTSLRYFREGGTIIGYDEKKIFYVYTPPPGWMCRYGEKP